MVERTLAWLNRCRRLAKAGSTLNLSVRCAFLLLALNQDSWSEGFAGSRNVSGQTLSSFV